MSGRGETAGEGLDHELQEFSVGETLYNEDGEAELVRRCGTCREMGYIDGGLPDACPGCGGARENLTYWTED